MLKAIVKYLAGEVVLGALKLVSMKGKKTKLLCKTAEWIYFSVWLVRDYVFPRRRV